ncbi:MAG: murein biosynthesis integral membrane protein MurJ [Anaerolineae bacterium]|nr:murein biosynthesis integral membrane protein MurJ [Anaerolineae bacterium]
MESSVKEPVLSVWRSRFQQVSGATLALTITGVLTRVITLLTQVIIAREFGLGIDSDAFFVTLSIPELFISFVGFGLSMAFIPLYTKYRATRGEDEAWTLSSSFFVLATFVSIIVAAIAVAGAPLIVSLIAPGFDGLARETAISLVRIMSLSIIFLGMDAGLRGLLHSHRDFIVPELARVVYNITLLIFALTLSSKFGVFVLAWGIVLGAFIQVAIQFLEVLKQGLLKLTWAFDRAGTKEIARQLLPFVITVSGLQIIYMIDRMVASGLPEGSITALEYASRIVLLPIGLFANPLRTTLFPNLSTLAAQRQLQELNESVLTGLKVLLFIIIPACVGMVVLRIPLTQLFFERGNFDSLATLATSKALFYYASGIPAFAVISVLNYVFLSLGNALSLISKLNIFNWLTNLLFSLILSHYMGYYGIALGTSISVTLTMVLMIYFLKRRHLKSLNVRSLLNSVYTVTLVSAIMGALLVLLLELSNHILVQLPLYYQFLQMVILILIGASTYLIIGYRLKLESLMILTRAFRKLI